MTTRQIVPDQTNSIVHYRQRESVTEQALAALAGRRTVQEFVKGTSRGTDYTYKMAWIDFAAFYLYLTGSKPPSYWTERGKDEEEMLSVLDGQIGHITAFEINKYREALLNKPVIDRKGRKKVGLENSTVNLRLSALQFLFKTAIRMGLRTDNPANPDMAARRKPNFAYRVPGLSVQEVEKLLSQIDCADFKGHRDYMLLSVLFYTGIRRSEAAQLAVSDFERQLDGSVLFMVKRKGDKTQQLYLPKQLESPIADYIAEWELDGWLFPSVEHDFSNGENSYDPLIPLTPDGITYIVRRRTKQILGKAVSPHPSRHTFITQALESGESLADVQDYVGHADPRTTKIYQDYKPKRIGNKIKWASSGIAEAEGEKRH